MPSMLGYCRITAQYVNFELHILLLELTLQFLHLHQVGSL